MNCQWHRHLSPEETVEIDQAHYYAEYEAGRVIARQIFPDVSGSIRIRLIHSGFRTRESVQAADDFTLLRLVHGWLQHGWLSERALLSLRLVLPYRGNAESAPEAR